MENGIDYVSGVQVVDVADKTLAHQLDGSGQLACPVQRDEGRAARTQAVIAARITARIVTRAGLGFEGIFS